MFALRVYRKLIGPGRGWSGRQHMNALAAAQRIYDMQIPDDQPAFLETDMGANWLDGAATQLVQGRDYRVNSHCGVDFDTYTIAIGERMKTIALDYDALGWLIAAVLDENKSMAREALHELIFDMGMKPIAFGYDVAESLLKPIAEEAAQQLRADNQ
jgi:hypothetical protein